MCEEKRGIPIAGGGKEGIKGMGKKGKLWQKRCESLGMRKMLAEGKE